MHICLLFLEVVCFSRTLRFTFPPTQVIQPNHLPHPDDKLPHFFGFLQKQKHLNTLANRPPKGNHQLQGRTPCILPKYSQIVCTHGWCQWHALLGVGHRSLPTQSTPDPDVTQEAYWFSVWYIGWGELIMTFRLGHRVPVFIEHFKGLSPPLPTLAYKPIYPEGTRQCSNLNAFFLKKWRKNPITLRCIGPMIWG